MTILQNQKGQEMPNFYNEGYMKEGLHSNGKLNSLARSNASLYGNKDDLYDRLKRHAYTGKKGEKLFKKLLNFPGFLNLFNW